MACPCTPGCPCPAAVPVVTAPPLPCPVTTFPPRDPGPHSRLASWSSWRRNIITTDISVDRGDWSWRPRWAWRRDKSRSGSRTGGWRQRRRVTAGLCPLQWQQSRDSRHICTCPPPLTTAPLDHCPQLTAMGRPWSMWRTLRTSSCCMRKSITLHLLCMRTSSAILS